FRGASRVGLARRLVDLSAVTIAAGGAGLVLAVGHADTRVGGAYAISGTLLLLVLGGVLVGRDGRIRMPMALAGAGAGCLALAAFAIGVYGALAVGVRQGLAGREKDAIARELERALEAQHELAITDGLTALHNRRFFEETLQLAAARSRGSRSVGLLVLDLDH